MAFTLPVGGGGGDFKRVPAGTHIAICNIVADLGIQPGSSMYPDPKRKVYLRFEIPGERIEYERDGQMVNGPATISREFTASMNEKATLRKFLEGWRGRKFTDDEAAKFDIGAVLGKPCLLSITETEKGGEVYSNIGSASPLIRGMAVENAENELLLYTEESQACFDRLPKRVKEKIQAQIPPRSESHRHSESDQERDPWLD